MNRTGGATLAVAVSIHSGTAEAAPLDCGSCANPSDNWLGYKSDLLDFELLKPGLEDSLETVISTLTSWLTQHSEPANAVVSWVNEKFLILIESALPRKDYLLQAKCSRTNKCLVGPEIEFSQTIFDNNIGGTVGPVTIKLSLNVKGESKGEARFDSTSGPTELVYGCGPNGSRTIVDYILGTATLSYEIKIGVGPAEVETSGEYPNALDVGLGDAIAKFPRPDGPPPAP